MKIFITFTIFGLLLLLWGIIGNMKGTQCTPHDVLIYIGVAAIIAGTNPFIKEK